MNINGIELELDIYEADTAERYEQALEIIKSVPKPDEDTKLSDNIRSQCYAVFDFFNALFGEGTDVRVFGESTNLNECLDATEQVILCINQQKNKLLSRVQKYHPADRKAQ